MEYSNQPLNPSITYRRALHTDVPAMAAIRAKEWGTEEYWIQRISGYMQGKIYPGDALPQRIIFLALDNKEVVGFIAGHLSTRLGCDGELEWINVCPEFRGKAIAGKLLYLLAEWFINNNAFKICVDPDDDARMFYAKKGATNLDQHWMVWNDIRVLLRPI